MRWVQHILLHARSNCHNEQGLHMLRTGPDWTPISSASVVPCTSFNILPNHLKGMGTKIRLYHKFLKFNHVKMYSQRINQTFQVWCQNRMQGWDCEGENWRWKFESLRGLWRVKYLMCCSVLILSPVGGGSVQSLSHSLAQEYGCDWGHWGNPTSGLFRHAH